MTKMMTMLMMMMMMMMTTTTMMMMIATSIASFLGCLQDEDIILRNYHSRSSVLRVDESNRTLAETEEIWAKLSIGKVGKTLKIWRQFSWFLTLPLSFQFA